MLSNLARAILLALSLPLAALAQSAQPLAPADLLAKHGAAIELGRQEFLLALKADPEMAGSEEADYMAYSDELMTGFLEGKNVWALEEFVRYAPRFTNYAATFAPDFALGEGLRSAQNISKQDAIQEEQNAIQAELQNLIDTLQAHSNCPPSP